VFLGRVTTKQQQQEKLEYTHACTMKSKNVLLVLLKRPEECVKVLLLGCCALWESPPPLEMYTAPLR